MKITKTSSKAAHARGCNKYAADDKCRNAVFRLFPLLRELPASLFLRRRSTGIPSVFFQLARKITNPPKDCPSRIHLNSGDLIRIEKDSGFGSIQIRRGAIWLTGTPANGDVLLMPESAFDLVDSWPFVVQALGPAEILLSPRSRKIPKTKSEIRDAGVGKLTLLKQETDFLVGRVLPCWCHK